MYYKDLLKARLLWLGVAMIWIVLFHLPVDLGIPYYIKSLGYGGVDICLFASGIGCFYSLSSDSDVINFMKRRLKRLVPTYLVFIVVWLAYRYLVETFGVRMAIGNIFAVQNFTGLGQDFNWYISAIFLLYILAPYFKAFVDRASTMQKILFLVFLVAFSIPFWNSHTYIITITRLPIFYIGILFGDISKKNIKIRGSHIIGMIIAFIAGTTAVIGSMICFPNILWSHGLYWYPFILITPPLCFAVSYISMLFEKTKLTRLIASFLSLCGDYSFEIYLVHMLLISVISSLIEKFEFFNNNILWAIGGILLIFGCFILRRLTNGICKLIYIKTKLKQ